MNSKIVGLFAGLLLVVGFAACDEPKADEPDDEVVGQAPEFEELEEAEVDEESASKLEFAAADFPTGPVTLVGTNSCLGCSLKGSHGAKSQCSDYGHDHALNIDYAEDAEGETIDNIIGHTVHYLENDAAAALIEGEEFHGDRVRIQGRLLGAAATLEVESFDKPSDAQKPIGSDVEPRTADVVITGQNSCLGCDLKGSHDAAAQCSDYGHTHALQIDEVRGEDGELIDTFAGRIVHYLANDAATDLIEGEEFHGEKVRVEGRLFADTSTLEVHNFSAPADN